MITVSYVTSLLQLINGGFWNYVMTPQHHGHTHQLKNNKYTSPI